MKAEKNHLNKEKPLVSIIIPAYNRANLIGETIESIIAQTYSNWECIVVDDGSTDNLKEVVEGYIKNEKRLKFYKRPSNFKPGGNGARNFGLEMSNGDYINWFDSDDIMMPKKLETQVNQMINSELNYSVCQSTFFKNDKNNLKGVRHSLSKKNNLESYISGKIAWGTFVPIWKKEFLVKNNISFNENLKAGQEWNYHCKALICDDKFLVTEESLVLIRVHDDNITNKTKVCKKLYHYYLSRKDINIILNEKYYERLFYEPYTVIYKKLIDAKCYYYALIILNNEFLIKKRFLKFTKLFLQTFFYIVFKKGRSKLNFK